VLLRIVARALAPRHRGGERERERERERETARMVVCVRERKRKKRQHVHLVVICESQPLVLSLKYVEASIRAGDGRTRSTLFLL
jgi:hypothetical protein